MRRRALLVVILVAVAAVVHVARSGDRGATDAAVYRHYFAIGKRACQLQAPEPVDGITRSGLTTAAIKVPRSAPAVQRRALIAGCQAAVG
jgi:hypothetical protein